MGKIESQWTEESLKHGLTYNSNSRHSPSLRPCVRTAIIYSSMYPEFAKGWEVGCNIPPDRIFGPSLAGLDLAVHFPNHNTAPSRRPTALRLVDIFEQPPLSQYCEAMGSLDCFPALSTVVVNLTEIAPYSIEYTTARWAIIESLIYSMARKSQTSMARKSQTCAIKSLTVQNMEARHAPFITNTAAFTAALANLAELHLQFCAVGPIEAPNRGFENGIIRTWLQPAAHNLESLSLYCTDHFGFCRLFRPDCDGLHFPKLRSLALGRLCFSSQAQFDWILTQRTLRWLVLDDCPIVHQANFSERAYERFWHREIGASDMWLVPLSREVEQEETARVSIQV